MTILGPYVINSTFSLKGKGRIGTDCGKRKRRIIRHESGQSEVDIILGKGIIYLKEERRHNDRVRKF